MRGWQRVVRAFGIAALALLQASCGELFCPDCNDLSHVADKGKDQSSHVADAGEEEGSPESDASQDQDPPDADASQDQDSPDADASQDQDSPDADASQDQDSPDADAKEDDGSPPLRESPFGALGGYPNFPLFGVKEGEISAKMMRDARFTAIALPLVWSEFFYSSNASCDEGGRCPTPTCAINQCPPCNLAAERCYWKPSDNPACRAQNLDELECYFAGYVVPWLQQLRSGSTVLFSIYGRPPPETWRFGPSFLRAIQHQPSDLHADPTWEMFRALYDRVDQLLFNYARDLALSLIIGIEGAPLGCPDSGSDEGYAVFFGKAVQHMHASHRRPAPPLVVSPSPFFSEACNGIWELEGESFSSREPVLKRLNELADGVAFSYFPFDRTNGWLALNPDRVVLDLAAMAAFRDGLAPLPGGGSKRPIVISAVGYSSDSGLHGQRPGVLRYSPFADGEVAQAELVKNLFASARARRQSNPSDPLFSLYWGPLVDIGDPDGALCIQQASQIGPSDLATRRAFCVSGLLRPLDKPTLDKPAWSALVSEAPETD